MEKMQHFSIRKLSIGAASVLIGISFLGVKASTVKADSLQNASATELTKSKTANEAIKQDADSDIKQEPASDIKQDTSSNNEQEPVSKTDAKQITNDQPSTDQVPAKPATPKLNSNQQNAADLEAKPQTPAKAKLQTNNAITPDKVGQSKVKVTTLMAVAGKKLNAQMLSESKVVSPANDTNGGFDEATWGKLNVNAWQGSVQGDYYQLTDYTGDANHIIVPNEADFAKAGISTSGKQVGVTSDLMHTIFTNKATAQDATIAFSKTDNKMIKAISRDWSYTWESQNGKLSKFDGTNLDVSNVTNMSYMFYNNQISDLSSLANWNTNNVSNMRYMFEQNQISDLNPLTNWKVDNVSDISGMFYFNHISNLSPLVNWNVNNVTSMYDMFGVNQISDLSPLANWKVNNVTDMNQMFEQNHISDLSPLANWKVDNVSNMGGMFGINQISDLSPLVNWKVDHVSDMSGMFQINHISDLSPLASWNVDNVTDMAGMFYSNRINDLKPLANWNVNEVTEMGYMFDDNATTQTKNLQAKRVINFVYPDGYTGKKQDTVTQTVDVPQTVNVTLTTKDSKPSNNILDWVTKTETPISTPTDPVYFQDYTVPEIKGLLEPDKTIISEQEADITKPINVTVTYKLVESNTNDAFALDPKNGLHEHADVNNNGGYNEDYWGKLNINDWNYTTNGDTITITGYKGNNPASLIIPNGADFGFINGQDNSNSRVEISSSVMHDLAKNATRIGLSKTANKKVIASNAIWQDAFGGLTNKPGTDSNADGGIIYGSPNLTQMDLHNLDTAAITNMSALFNGGSNLTTVGDLSDWNTSNVTNMRNMFQTASSLTNIGNLDNWDTSKVTDMTNMFHNATNLTNIGDLSKWQTGNVTNMNSMFSNTTNLTNIGNLDDWNTSKVTDMHWMFGTDTGKQSHLTNIGDLSKWQTGNVTDMHNMFANATSLTNIGNLDNWNTSKVTDMSWMFGTDTGKQSHLTNIGDLSKWQTGNVTNMNSMFSNATSLTNIGNLDNWTTSKVTDMHWMFGGTMNLTNIGDLSKWQTGNVTDMNGMFANATSLTNIGNLDNWDTNKVTDMHLMFAVDYSKQSHLTHIGDLSKWDTSHVTDMNNMFANKALLHLNISNWNLTKLANKDAMKYMFANVTNLTVIANDLKLPAWYQNEINDADYFWNNHIAVITNVPELIRATGDIDNLKIDDQDASRSIFYDSKGSSDAIQVLKDANNQYIADYHKANPTKFLKLADTVDQNDPIALANASFITVPYKLAVSNTNDAFALDSKNGLHEHANVNDNGGYDADFWGKINVDDWNYTVNGDRIEINGLKDGASTGANDAVIVPNLDDFKLVGKDDGAKAVYISRSTLGETAKHKYYGLSKTNGNKFTTDSDLNSAFYKNSNLTHADLNSLNTGEVTNMRYMFGNTENLTSLDVSKWNTSNVTSMSGTFSGASRLTSLDVSKWDTSNVTTMYAMFSGASSLTIIDVSKWNTGEVTNMSMMFYGASNLTSLDVSNWDTSKVTDMSWMFNGASSLTSLDVSKWNTGNVTNMFYMFSGDPKLDLIVNGDKFADYLAKNNFADSRINSSVKSVTTNNAKLLKLLTSDAQHDSSTRTITFTFPANYSPDLTKYHLTKVGNTYQIKQSADYDKPYLQGTVLINATGDITEHHIDTTKLYKLSDTWQPNYNKLVLAHKNSNGTVSFDDIQLPQIPGYKTVASLVNPARALFAVSFMALPKPVTPAINDVKPAETVTPEAPATTEVAKPIKTEPKAATSAAKVIDLPDDAVATTPKDTTWHVVDEPEQDTYRVSNGKYAVELPHISNAQLHVIANDSTKDSVLFTYKGQNTHYVFNIKFVDGHYLLTTYEIKSGKLVKLIDYNFIKASKMSDFIRDWLDL